MATLASIFNYDYRTRQGQSVSSPSWTAVSWDLGSSAIGSGGVSTYLSGAKPIRKTGREMNFYEELKKEITEWLSIQGEQK